MAGGLVANALIVESPCFALVLAQNEEKSKEFLAQKIRPLLVAAGVAFSPGGDLKTSLTLANGSRVIGLPDSERGVRGYAGVNLLVIDEASRVGDDLYRACRPMLGVSRGRLVAASTPFGKRGWFFEEWERGGWHRERITAHECPRYTREFLAEEEVSMGDRWFRQEYLAAFENAIDSVFSLDDIQAAFRHDVQPLVARG